MIWKRKKKIEIKIEFKKDSKDIRVAVEPTDVRPTEVIQILLFAINTVDGVMKKEMEKISGPKKKKKTISYIE